MSKYTLAGRSWDQLQCQSSEDAETHGNKVGITSSNVQFTRQEIDPRHRHSGTDTFE